MSEKTKKQKTIPELWYEFFLGTIALDKGQEPYGRHWLNAISELIEVPIKNIQAELSEEHPLKSFVISPAATEHLVKKLKKDLGNPPTINKIDFSGIHFKEKTNFLSLVFPVDVYFEHAEFFDNANFGLAVFQKYVSFNNTKFHKKAYFTNAKFHLLALFQKAVFSKETHFSDAEFVVGDFSQANFAINVTFNKANFSELVIFRDTIFSGFTRFSSATFEGSANFANAEFKFCPPHFYKVEIKADITWLNAKWPSIDKAAAKGLLDQSQTAYENLAYHMKKLDKYHDQHFFFRQEMRCRKRLGNFFNRFAYELYEILADYGYGVGRAVFWWAAHMFFGASILYLFVFYNKSISDRLVCSILNSATNAHSYVFSKGNRLEHCYKETDMLLVDVVWATQTIVGLIFLFLLGLTLRVRFRMG